MGLSHNEIVKRYAKGIAPWVKYNLKDPVKSYRGSNVFNDGPTLYSYGRHFVLATVGENCAVLNGDKYSVSTSKHQSITRYHLSGLPHCIIPFSALDAAGIVPEKIRMVDKTEDEYRDVEYKDPKTGEMETRQEHLLGSTLFEYEGGYYLSSTDPSGNWGRNYFLTKLKLGALPPATVADAYFLLKPSLVLQAELEEGGIEVKRQGEWFFIPRTFSLVGKRGLKVEKQFVLPRKEGTSSNNEHVVRDAVNVNGALLCRGTVRHGSTIRRWDYNSQTYINVRSIGDHKMLKLGEVWHEAIENVQERSWSTGGKVD